jgi:hypothetical protein
MPRRRRHAPTESESHSDEVWPAYVDVLSAAFVFVLLAFCAMLTNQLSAVAKPNPEPVVDGPATPLPISSPVGEVGGDFIELLPDELKGVCALVSAELQAMDPALVGIYHQALIDRDGRHPLTVVCSLDNNLVRFASRSSMPEYTKTSVKPALGELAMLALSQPCAEADAADWCVSGLEVVGHADCRRLGDEYTSTTNWELSTNRAGAVIRDMLAHISDDLVPPAPFRIGAGGREAREPIAPLVGCDTPSPDSVEQWALDKNRRVEVRVFLKTEVLPQAR